ncbi:MAG: ABC transporter permease [Rhizobiales bacterium 65-79]|jgi:peptide/nickel transport system permease protein|nr:ABC transporter permease [Hyphomicrobiales bacterium]OJU03915.1 MAG: ABC transporter permease [Rhizobiales bacterium 65-79]
MRRVLASLPRRDWIFVLSVIVLVLVLGMALSARLLFPGGPWEVVGPPVVPPFTKGFLLGTDTIGRSVLAGIFYGARVSLLVGIVATALPFLLGMLIGAIAGYSGGLVDDALMRLTELFQTVPHFMLALVLVAILTPSITSIIIAISVVSWPPVARLVRAEFLSLRNREFVEAAVLAGRSHTSIVFKEILPNALGPVVVMASLMVATAILLEAAISFIGLGDPNLMSWGYMVGASRTALRTAWWVSVVPGLAVFLTVLAINFVGEALNEALNPRSALRAYK